VGYGNTNAGLGSLAEARSRSKSSLLCTLYRILCLIFPAEHSQHIGTSVFHDNSQVLCGCPAVWAAQPVIHLPLTPLMFKDKNNSKNRKFSLTHILIKLKCTGKFFILIKFDASSFVSAILLIFQ